MSKAVLRIHDHKAPPYVIWHFIRPLVFKWSPQNLSDSLRAEVIVSELKPVFAKTCPSFCQIVVRLLGSLSGSSSGWISSPCCVKSQVMYCGYKTELGLNELLLLPRSCTKH